MRWNITRDGNAIEWLVTDLHTDDIEMAGFGCAAGALGAGCANPFASSRPWRYSWNFR